MSLRSLFTIKVYLQRARLYVEIRAVASFSWSKPRSFETIFNGSSSAMKTPSVSSSCENLILVKCKMADRIIKTSRISF